MSMSILNPEKSCAYLMKRSQDDKKWKRRCFVYEEQQHSLHMYRSPEDIVTGRSGIEMYLSEYQVNTVDDEIHIIHDGRVIFRLKGEPELFDSKFRPQNNLLLEKLRLISASNP